MTKLTETVGADMRTITGPAWIVNFEGDKRVAGKVGTGEG